MLETLTNLIFNKKDGKNSQYSDLSGLEPTNPNFLTDPDKIIQLLKNIEEASPLCTINIDGITEEFNSSILDIQSEENKIILDELTPKHGHELLINQNKLKLSTIYNGIHLAFTLAGIRTDTSEGIAYYKATLPSRIYYPQRRSSPRTIINYNNLSFSGVSSRNQSTVGGKVFDISRVGLGVTLPDNRARFQRGDSVNNCQITLDSYAMKFDLVIRFVKKGKQGSDQTQIGGLFENLSSKSKSKLEHYVSIMEGEYIRTRKRKE